jgi:hypothetical protein
MRGHTFHQPIESNKDITMKRKNFKNKNRQIPESSTGPRRPNSLKEQRKRGNQDADVGDVGKVVTRYELEGVAYFAILPDQLDRMRAEDIEDLFDAGESLTWRLTLQTAHACYALNLYPKELKRAFLKRGYRQEAEQNKANEAPVTQPAATDDGTVTACRTGVDSEHPTDQAVNAERSGYSSECVKRHTVLGSAYFRVDPTQASMMPADVLQRFRDAAEHRLWRLDIHTKDEVFVTHMVAQDLLRACENDLQPDPENADGPARE